VRYEFVRTLLELSEADNRIFLITGDLGFRVLEPFAEKFPDRFLNAGVAEQNIVGIATGLAQAGFIPFIYSIASFAIMRPYEQIRNGPILHNLPVRIIGIGGGYAYGHQGFTHYALEDLAIARTQPGMTVVAPADPAQTRNAVKALTRIPGTVYLRLGKGQDREVPGLDGKFALGSPEVVRDGRDLLFICTGTIVHEALKAADFLYESGVSAAVAVLAHLGFSGSLELKDLLSCFKFVVTVEEGYMTGGLGSLVAETIAQETLECRLIIKGVKKLYQGFSGSQRFLRVQNGLNAEALVEEYQNLIVC
jgi:transketolase